MSEMKVSWLVTERSDGSPEIQLFSQTHRTICSDGPASELVGIFKGLTPCCLGCCGGRRRKGVNLPGEGPLGIPGESRLTAGAPHGAAGEKGSGRAAGCLSRDDGFSPPRGRGLREPPPRPCLGDPGVGAAGAGLLGARRGLGTGQGAPVLQPALHHLHSPLTWLGLGPGPADFSTKQERAEGTREPGHALGPSADTPDWLREGGRHQRQSGPLGWAPQRTWSPQPVLGPISPLRLHLRPAGGLRNEAESLPLVSLGLPPIRENFRPLQSV